MYVPIYSLPFLGRPRVGPYIVAIFVCEYHKFLGVNACVFILTCITNYLYIKFVMSLWFNMQTNKTMHCYFCELVLYENCRYYKRNNSAKQ